MSSIQRRIVVGLLSYLESSGMSIRQVRSWVYGRSEEAQNARKAAYAENRVAVLARCKEYVAKNEERVREYKHKHYLQNKEKICRQSKNWRERNKERAAARARRYYDQNRERISAYKKQWTASLDREELLESKKRWYKENKERIREHYATPEVRQRIANYERKRRQEDPNYRLGKIIRGRIRNLVKSGRKSARSLELAGCSWEELRSHLEARFEPGMTWENMGYGGWEIDHIRPCASFPDLGTSPEQQRECFHYTNLQPLWYWDNRSKRDKWNPDTTV